VIMAADVPAFGGPNAASREVARLSYDVVHLMDDSVGQFFPYAKWVHIHLPKGGDGFVRASQVFRGADASLTFIRRKNGTWRLNDYSFPYP
jgi:hypothetical protein